MVKASLGSKSLLKTITFISRCKIKLSASKRGLSFVVKGWSRLKVGHHKLARLVSLIYFCLVFFFNFFFHLLEFLLVVVKSKSFSPSASMAFHVVINRLLTGRCRLDIHYSERDTHPLANQGTGTLVRTASSHYAARIQNT